MKFNVGMYEAKITSAVNKFKSPYFFITSHPCQPQSLLGFLWYLYLAIQFTFRRETVLAV